MTTLVIPSGRQTATYTSAAVTVFDTETNDPFFLSDWEDYRADGATNSPASYAYPCRIDAAAPGFVWNGGRFYGNIPQSVSWDNFYEGGRITGIPTPQAARFNSALIFPRNGVTGTFNDLEFGIRDDLDSGYVDAMRVSQAGPITINRARVWLSRDDFLECDTNDGKSVTINDSFFENMFLWLSGTGNVPNTVFRVNRSLVHFGPWLFRNSFPEYGAPLKVENAAGSPRFLFSDVCLVIGPDDYTSKDRMKAALSRTQATNGCRLLVLGGTHVDRQLIQAYQNAGFSVLEDGSGTAATQEWLNRKSAFLNEGGGVVTPPAAPSLTSPCAVETFVGTPPAPTLTIPVLKGLKISGENTQLNALVADHTAIATGDLVMLLPINDGGTNIVTNQTVTGPNGETVTKHPFGDPATFMASDGNSGTSGHSMGCHSFVATADQVEDAGITCAFAGTARVPTVAVAVFEAGTFDPASPVMQIFPTGSAAGVAEALSAAFTAAGDDGKILFVAGRAFDPFTAAAPTGWTYLSAIDLGTLPAYAAIRTAETTEDESVAAATFAASSNHPFVGLTVVVRPASS